MPTEDQLLLYIAETNSLAQVSIAVDDILKTMSKTIMHPAAAGHFTAIHYVMDHARKPAFPCKHPNDYATPLDCDTNLTWLRKLHKVIMGPFPQYPQYINPEEPLIAAGDCGNYRIKQAYGLYGKALPAPEIIIKLMNWWYTDLCQFHNTMLPALKKPTSLKIEQIQSLAKMAQDKHLQLLCIHPWTDGNGRTARLLENLLRLRWTLPWKNYLSKDRIKYTNDIFNYEDNIWRPIQHQIT